MPTIVPSDESSLRPFHDHLIAKLPKVLANAGMRATIELAAAIDAPDSMVFWRITVLQEDEDEDIHAKISDAKDGIEASIAYLDRARLDCYPQCVRWFVAKPHRRSSRGFREGDVCFSKCCADAFLEQGT